MIWAGFLKRTRLFDLLLYIGVGAAALSLTNCTLKESAPEQPYPSESRVSRGFFETTGKDGRAKLKTFLAGWSPEMTAGESQGAIMDHYNHAGHANIVFEITHGKLIGKMVNASYMTSTQDCLDRDSKQAKDCRNRWSNVITIDITKHFYFERRKDSRGRTTDEMIENDSRSDWSARPYMNLDLGSIEIKDWGMMLLAPGMRVDNVEDIEWDFSKSFLGFTVTATDGAAGSAVQGRFRYNFLAFDHNPKFIKTPYRPSNAKNINVLHVIGKYVDGDPGNPITFAAHWDVSKGKKQQISLYGFPKEHEVIGFDVINQWNDSFEKVGKGRPFEAVVTERKYAFDLRYPSITWVDDRRLSSSAPLGVGMALADVRNGQILWGGVTLWAGMIEEYINRSAPNSDSGSDAGSAGKNLVQLGLMEPTQLVPTNRSSVPKELTNANSFEAVRTSLLRSFGQEAQALKQISQRLTDATPKSLVQMAQEDSIVGISTEDLNPVKALNDSAANKVLSPIDVSKMLDQRQRGIEDLVSGKNQMIDAMSKDLVELSGRFQQMALQNGSTEKILTADYVQQLINMPKLNESLSSLPTKDKANLAGKLSQNRNLSRAEMMELLNTQGSFGKNWSAAGFDSDRTFAEVAPSWSSAIGEFSIDKREAYRSVVKNILLHEVGHMLGLGHNFKENILPEDDSLPKHSKHIGWVQNGKYQDFSMAQLKKDAHNNFRNYTTVMGYMAGETEVSLTYDDLKIGPADLLSLHFLYNQQYPIYPNEAKGTGDLEFEKLKEDGLIRENIVRTSKSGQNKTYRPAYFPGCNDFYASMGTDPYCNRWDRGYNAQTIIKNHFESYKGNLVSSLNAFSNTVKGGSFWASEGYLWDRSLSTMGRIRIFYDYMRQKYETDIRALISSGSDQGGQNLLDFSDACQKVNKGEATNNAVLSRLFSRDDRKELLDLCVANAYAIGQLDSLLQLPGRDYTQIDYLDKYMSYLTGGEGSTAYGRAFGSWKELARTPIKISALLTLTSPYPYNFRSGWTWPVEQYSRQDGSYHISTLYPKEYTAAVASATEMNLTVGNGGIDQKTSIGRTVLAMGYYLNNTYSSNDILSVSTPYIENIRNQTQFRYSLAIIDIQRKDEDGKEIAKKFTGTLHNIYSVGPETLPEVYMYKDNRTVTMPPPHSLLLPMSSIRWYTPSAGYYTAIKLDYADDYYDRLKAKSVRKTLEDMYYEVMKKCVQGENRNGLRFFFNDSVDENLFSGFEFPKTIAERTTDQNKFFASIELKFKDYYGNRTLGANPATCEQALRGQGLLVIAASVLNGYYLGNMGDFMEKANTW